MPIGRLWRRTGTACTNEPVAFKDAIGGVVQTSLQAAPSGLPLPSSGQFLQSVIDIVPSSDIAMSSDIAFALTACTMLLAANTARSIMTMSDPSLLINYLYCRACSLSIHDPVSRMAARAQPSGPSQRINHHSAQRDSFATT